MKFIITLCLLVTFTPCMYAANYYVTNTNDSGVGSLRAALDAANANSGADQVLFDIEGQGWHLIKLQSGVLKITDPVTIDGYSQPGADPFSGEKRIIVSGLALPPGSIFMITSTGGKSLIQGLVMDGVKNGGAIWINNSNQNKILGNFIGTDSTGKVSANISSDYGIKMDEKSKGNVIGNATKGGRNLISGISKISTAGIRIETLGTNNQVVGNYIGTNYSGSYAISNHRGIYVANGSGTIIDGNIISGNNASNGSGIFFSNVTGSIIENNTIGLDRSQTSAIPNGDGIGIYSSESIRVINNIISGNDGSGLIIISTIRSLVTNNFIGTDGTGMKPIGNNSMGIHIAVSSNNLIGGTISTKANVISGNGIHGIYSHNASKNTYLGNIIGLNKKGVVSSTSMGNQADGMFFLSLGSTGGDNTIGGSDIIGHANIICSNGIDGIKIWDSNNNTFLGNRIGEDRFGNPAGNGSNGIFLASSNNIIGSSKAGESNFISNNGTTDNTANGIYVSVWSGNLITHNQIYNNASTGVLVHGGSAIISNSVYNNGNLGIDLLSSFNSGFDVTPNDTNMDNDTGGNGLQNFPVLTTVMTLGQNVTQVDGTLHSKPNKIYYIEVFVNSNAIPGAIDPSGYGEGHELIRGFLVGTNSSGNAQFQEFFVPNQLVPDGLYTSTATEVTVDNGQITAYYGTSEFSAQLAPTPDNSNARSRAIDQEANSFVATTLSVFPNAASHELTISLQGTDKELVELAVINSWGETVQRHRWDVNKGHEISIEVDNLPAGIYYVSTSGTGWSKTVRFIKE